MRKQKMQMVVLLAILVVLGITFFSVKQYNKAEAAKEEEEIDGEVIIDVSSDDIVKFSYDYEGETYSFYYNADDETWYSADDETLTLKQYRTSSLTSGVAPLIASQVIENVTDLEQYGLTEPQMTINYETASESYIIYVGDNNEVTSTYYVCLPSESMVYVVDASDINKLHVTLDDLIDTSADDEETVSDGDAGTVSDADAEVESALEESVESDAASETTILN